MWNTGDDNDDDENDAKLKKKRRLVGRDMGAISMTASDGTLCSTQ